MSKIKERDEQEALKLDEHFKQTLTYVRTYILNLRSVKEAHLCRIWLDKLNTTSQRNLRNEYLLELSRQLRIGTLEGIFKTEPPNGLLTPLPSSCHVVCISSSLSEPSDWNRNHQNCSTLNRTLDQRNRLRNKLKLHDFNSSSSIYVPRQHDDDVTEGNHLELCKYRIDILTTTLENLRIQNERLRQELTTKCRGNNEISNETFRLRNRVKQLTAQAQIRSLAWKVRLLKKTIAKLKKLNDSIRHIYEKKLQRIIRNKNLEIKILQLQFQKQKSELCLLLYSEKQNELYTLTRSLEEKYKTLLATTLESQRQEYFMKIIALEAELCHLRRPISEVNEDERKGT